MFFCDNYNNLILFLRPNTDCENYTVFNIGSEISSVKLWWKYVFVGHTDGLITVIYIKNYIFNDFIKFQI